MATADNYVYEPGTYEYALIVDSTDSRFTEFKTKGVTHLADRLTHWQVVQSLTEGARQNHPNEPVLFASSARSRVLLRRV